VRVHRDTRRDFFGDIFELPNGDLNVVKLKRHVPIAWHRHQHQVDRLFCVSGRVRVGMRQEFADEDSTEHWFTLREGCTLMVPSNTWHGYESLTKDGVLVQFNSPKYNPDDEQRHPIDDEMPWDAE
jgi:dTDP-4-dehydrorhamnose 3,5-epimerase-like enzyme